MSRHFLAAIVGTLLAPTSVYADGLNALWLEPSSDWYGVDGNWSSLGLFVGEPAQGVDVTVSTSLSEIWLVETGGCSPNALCTAARGGVYDTSASHSWSSLGAWQLGLNYLGLGGNGDYAMETVVVYDSIRQWQTPFNKQIVAGINDTDYYTGFFGLGITPGRFGSVVAQSPIAALVERDGIIPSHSYGYTAGAYYGGTSGTPLSLTLGGYDANRFEPHDTKFSLNATTRQPEVRLRAITASVSDIETAPTSWSSTSVPLSFFNQSVTALLDSSTPYLWLPSDICDRFAANLDLKWNETLGVYVFPDNDNLERFRSSSDLSFTFALSSIDNQDDFGKPLDVPGVVNITITANAFIQSLRYPFMDLIGYGAPAVPYFPLKRADNDSRIIIGRTFLQEAYMITNYETSTFSVHQARFPDDALRNTSIHTIATSPRSPYPGPPGMPDGDDGLTETQIAGLVVGACLLGIAIMLTVWFVRRRKKRPRAAQNEGDDLKDMASTSDSEPPKSPVGWIFSKMTARFPFRKEGRRKGNDIYEVGADWSHERYEMSAQIAPAELEAANSKPSNATTDFQAKEPHITSTYEFVQLQTALQAQGMTTPDYAPRIVEPHAKTYEDFGPVGHYQLPETMQIPSPASSPMRDNYSSDIPSPLTPHSDLSTLVPDFTPTMGFVPARTLSKSNSNPSMVYAPPSPGSFGTASSLARSASNCGSTTSCTGSLMPPQPSCQRTPIDPSRVVCLGPLPDNVRLPNQPPISRVVVPDGHVFPMPTLPSADELRRESTADTLGSNFTVEEEAREAEDRAFTHTFGRLDGFDIVHVPQPAQKRYSWEDTR